MTNSKIRALAACGLFDTVEGACVALERALFGPAEVRAALAKKVDDEAATLQDSIRAADARGGRREWPAHIVAHAQRMRARPEPNRPGYHAIATTLQQFYGLDSLSPHTVRTWCEKCTPI